MEDEDLNTTNVSDEDLERSVYNFHLALNLKPSQVDGEQLKEHYKKRVEFWNDFMEKWSSADHEDDEGVDPENFQIEEDNEDEDQEDDDNQEQDDDQSHADDELTSSESEDDKNDNNQDETWVKEIQSVQNNVTIIEEVDDMPCDICGERTYLPFEYMENVGESLCNDCMVLKSGHEDCEIEKCAICIQIAKEMVDRSQISYLFCTSQLAVVRDGPDVSRSSQSPSKNPEETHLNRSLVSPKRTAKVSEIFQDLQISESSPPKRPKKPSKSSNSAPKKGSFVIPEGSVKVPSPSPRHLNTLPTTKRFKLRPLK